MNPVNRSRKVRMRTVRDRVRKFGLVEGYRVVKWIRGITNSKSTVREIDSKIEGVGFFVLSFLFLF